MRSQADVVEELRSYKLALSLHEALGHSSGVLGSPQAGGAPTMQTTPSGRSSTKSSDSVSEDDGAASLARPVLASTLGFQPYHSRSVPRSENLEAIASEGAASGAVTTMMLRNVPNRYTQNILLKEINDLGFAGTYDFFYLPMDVHNRSNVGYAFINFEAPADAERFRREFSEHRFHRFLSRKIGSVCVAHVQGLDANLRHFENRAVTQARNNQYRPLVLRGQQRVDFDQAVALARAKERQPQAVGGTAPACAAPQVFVQAPACAAPVPGAHVPAGDAGSPRQGLEAAIRKLLVASVKPPPPPPPPPPAASTATPAAGPIKSAAWTREDGAAGKASDAADVNQLLSLRRMLMDQLHPSKDPRRSPGGSPTAMPPPVWHRPAPGLSSPSGDSSPMDSPAYVNPISCGPYAPMHAVSPMCRTAASEVFNTYTNAGIAL